MIQNVSSIECVIMVEVDTYIAYKYIKYLIHKTTNLIFINNNNFTKILINSQ